MKTRTGTPQGLLLDLDGVFYVGDQLIAGARATVAFLQQSGMAH